MCICESNAKLLGHPKIIETGTLYVTNANFSININMLDTVL